MSGVVDNNRRGRPRLARVLKLRLFLRSLALQGSWNHERMQNLGLLVTLLPWLRRQPSDINRDRLFCRRYYEYFNTNPYLANLIIGGLVRLEQESLDSGVGGSAMARTKRAFALQSSVRSTEKRKASPNP